MTHYERTRSTGESVHLSHQPGAGQPLCKDLWTHWRNAQATHCIAVDARGCGKVDNRTIIPLPPGRAGVSG